MNSEPEESQHGQHCVILVYSTSYAIQGENVLEDAGIVCKLIPVPRHLSSDCGVCIRIRRSDKSEVLQLFDNLGFDYEACYDL